MLGFARLGGDLLAVGSVPGADGRAPGAWLGSPGAGWRAVPLQASSGYGRQAELTLPAVSGERILALGQAFGGAHGNPRLTIWSGAASGLVEYPQPVELLGGPRAMAVTASAATSSGALLVGQWDHERGGPGASAWTSPDGREWARVDEPALQSTPDGQTSMRGAAGRGAELVAVGEVRGAGSGSPRTDPLAWSSVDGRGWRRAPLGVPEGAANTSAERIACDTAGCVAVGVTVRYDGPDGGTQRFVCWQSGPGDAWGAPVSGEPAMTGSQLPEVAGLVADGDRLLVAATANGRARLWSTDRRCGNWRELTLPEESRGIAVAVADQPPWGRGVLLATIARDASRLWWLGNA